MPDGLCMSSFTVDLTFKFLRIRRPLFCPFRQKKIKLHFLSGPKIQLTFWKYFIPADRGNNYVK